MTKEELDKPITLNNLMETLVTFNEEKAIPRMKEVMNEVFDEKFQEHFDKSFTKNFEEKIKPEILKSGQASRDWTDKRIDRAEGNIVAKINTLTNVLEEKDILSPEDVRMVKRAGIEV